MNKLKKWIACALTICTLISMVGCANTNSTVDPNKTGDTTATVAPNQEYEKTYNIIFSLATVPPVIGALESISNGYETYAIIERGKTYNGIEELEYFHNAGFDPTSNLSAGFTDVEFNAMVDQVKALADKNTFFNFYMQDGTALLAAAIAGNAGLSTKQFHVYMVEDGVGAYNAVRDTYTNLRPVTKDDDQPYDLFVRNVQNITKEYKTLVSRNTNVVTDVTYNIAKAFPLATLDNFTFILQDESAIVDILKNNIEGESKLFNCFGIEGYSSDNKYSLNIEYKKIADCVKSLTEQQRDDYVTLMYGQYKDATVSALTRTQRADETAPSKKLVFIGTRHGDYPKFASNPAHGIGGLSDAVPQSYDDLDAKYKNDLLFATEEDYTQFLAVLNNDDNFDASITKEAKQLAQTAAFNVYIDYMYSLKFTYSLYGQDYDIVMKGHPREVIGDHDEWTQHYDVFLPDGNTYRYNKLMDELLLAFHANDSVGKLIGAVPYGTSAENLAYLGANITIAGLPSSTYTGYYTDIDVLFIMTESYQDIAGSGEAVVDSSVASRFEAGNLLYTDKNEVKQTTIFFNTGNVLKYASEIMQNAGDYDNAQHYLTLYTDWLAEYANGATDIDAQGFPTN